jgi:SAM-dependent methyltransferase
MAERSMAELAQEVERAIARLREQRLRSDGLLAHWSARLDGWIRTDEREHLDDPDFPATTKLAMVQTLHRFNQLFLSYHRFCRYLRPRIEAVHAATRRPARLLELACGAGELSLALASYAARTRVPLEVTGSDYIPGYIDAARAAAAHRGSPARFRVLNAFDLQLPPDSYDLVVIAQSLHHFTPGQLALMIAQARGSVSTAFVGIDGRRSLGNLLLVPGTALLSLRRAYLHDALITARRLYAADELAMIGTLAAPGCAVTVDQSLLGFSVLNVRF